MTATILDGLAARLARMPPFDRLTASELDDVVALLEPCRYRFGQTVLRADVLPSGVLLVLSGQLRSLATLPGSPEWRTIDRLGAGDLAGWVGLLRAEPCEHLRASSEVEAALLPADLFQQLLTRRPALAAWFAEQLPAPELHQLLVALAPREPSAQAYLGHWPPPPGSVRLVALAPGSESSPAALDPSCHWWVSSGAPLAGAWEAASASAPLNPDAAWLRLIGLPTVLEPDTEPQQPPLSPAQEPQSSTPSAMAAVPAVPAMASGPEPQAYSSSPEAPPLPRAGSGGELRLARASGPIDTPVAICASLARYFQLPFNRDAVLEQVQAVLQRQGRLNLTNLGQLLDGLGLRVVLTRLPADRLGRVVPPAVLIDGPHIGILDGVDSDGSVRLLETELGPVRVPAAELASAEDGQVELLLLQRRSDSKTARFSWGWYAPFLKEHRRELIEVLAASLVVNILALATPLGMQVLIDSVVRNQNVGALISISALLLLASLGGAVVRSLRSFIFTDVANRIDQATKATILDQMVRLPQNFFDSRPVGQITFYFSQLDRLREFLIGQSLTTVVDFLFSFIYIFILLAINPLLTLVALSTVPLLLVLALVSNPLVWRQIQRSVGEAVKTYSFLNEAITGIQTIKSQNAELKTRWEFQNRYARFIGEDFKLKITNESIANLARFLSELNGLLVIGFGIYLVMNNQITLGGFIAFRIISGYITGPLLQVVQTWQQFKMSSAQLQMVGDIVDRTTEQTIEESVNIPMPPLSGRVEFRDVMFRFSDETPQILQNINLEIPAGTFVGMVGGSGSGKSTLLKLLPRFYRPQAGQVLIDGLDINKVELYSLRRQVGVVPQDSLLFDGTIRENLLLVKPDASAAELIRAARIACAHDFIMDLPQGYNSSVGERGAGLSGGQRQRIALARAVLQNPRLLILDEATSALDARTERQLCRNLFEAFRNRTVFFITHRLSTVRPADVIVVMDRGAIMEVGSHRQLMDLQGWYYALYQSQANEGVS
ncbi:MAG: ATP-binding cassette domain-containing protein [Prochlorococcaceae cyanobacterium]